MKEKYIHIFNVVPDFLDPTDNIKIFMFLKQFPTHLRL